MNTDFFEGKTTVYTVNFPEDSVESLERLVVVLEGLLPEGDVCIKQHTGYCHIAISTYEDLTE